MHQSMITCFKNVVADTLSRIYTVSRSSKTQENVPVQPFDKKQHIAGFTTRE